MSGIRTCLRRWRARRARDLAGLLAVTALFAGPAASGGSALLHRHDDAGEHAHRLPAAVRVGQGVLAAFWHENQHLHDQHDDDGRRPMDGLRADASLHHVPAGTVLDSPSTPLARPDGSGDGTDLPEAAPVLHGTALAAWTSAPSGCEPSATRPRARAAGALRVLLCDGALRI